MKMARIRIRWQFGETTGHPVGESPDLEEIAEPQGCMNELRGRQIGEGGGI